jgi:hypothetical protein
VLQGRLEKILERYLTRLSPLADVRMEGKDRLCGEDLADMRHLREPSAFRYTARLGNGQVLPVERAADGGICVTIPHVAPADGAADDAPSRYVRMTVEDGVASGQLVVDLYDLAPARGYRLAGVERPEG